MDIELRNIEVSSLFKLKSLRIPAKEKLLIYGPSGRGKTSLLHLIGGLWKPSHGEILIQGQNICAMEDAELSHWRRKNLGFVFQKMNLVEHMTCEENLQLVAGSSAANIEKALEDVGLIAKLKTKAAALSLGEQQRLAVVRVLLQNPQIILADEPTSSLDEANALKVLQLLMAASLHKTLIVVSHDTRLQKHFDRCLDFEGLVVS